MDAEKEELENEELENEETETDETEDDADGGEEEAGGAKDTDETEEGDGGDEDDADEGDDEEDAEKDEALGARAQKRIGKLVKERNAANAEVETLKRQLDDAKKLSGDDGKAILRAAEASGILPGLMSKEEAEAFEVIEQYPTVIENYQEWLDDHGPEDEFGSGESAMTYGQVKKRVRKLEARLQDVREAYGERRKDLKKRVREIFEAGIAALKAGKAKAAAAAAADKKRKVKKTMDTPEARGDRHARRAARPEDMDVENEQDLENFIAATLRRKKE